MVNAIGIDLGGTYIRIARINTYGEIEEIFKMETNFSNNEKLAQSIIENINKIKNDATKGIGFGVPGQVDNTNGMVLHCVNLHMRNFPLGKIVAEGTNLPLILNNDANVAALGEAMIGAGSNEAIVYYLTWSTGIGGGLVVNGKVITGPNYYTGEVGNIIISPDDEYKHGVMNKGGFEGLASGTALKRYADELGYNDVKSLVEAFTNDEQKAVDKIEMVTDVFARGLANICHVIEADCFVIGGGVILKSGDVLLPLVKEKVNNYVMPHFTDKINIRKAQLGDNSGLIGAAFLVLNN